MDQLKECKALLVDYCNQTNLHGVSHLVSKRSKWWKVLWVICISLSLSYLLMQIIKVTERYQAKTIEVQEEVRIKDFLSTLLL